MGWYADSSWDITFHSEEAMKKALKSLDVPKYEGMNPFEALLSEFGEMANADEMFALEEGDPPGFFGWTTGKWFSESDSNLKVLAEYADGEVEFTCDEGPYKVVLKDGKATWIEGVVIYPADPNCEWIRKEEK